MRRPSPKAATSGCGDIRIGHAVAPDGPSAGARGVRGHGRQPGVPFRERTKPLYLFFVLLCAGTAWGQNVTLEVQPAAAAVSPGYRQIEARVILKNGSEAAVLNPALAVFTNDGFQVDVVGKGPGNVAKGQSFVWPVEVKNVNGARLPGTILFQASYSPAANAPRQHVFGTLSVTAAEDPQKPVEISLEGTFDAISDNRPGLGYLVVINNLEVPVNITSVEIQRPSGIKELPKIKPFTVDARGTADKEIKLEAENQITPGKYVLLLNVRAEWNVGGHPQLRSFSLSKQVSLGIFFESELLKLLGIPSFLLLPGCLLLFTMQLLVTLGVHGIKNESRLPQLPATSSGFWIIAVTFSGVFAYTYYKVTGSNYLVQYGVDDLRNVWVSSIAIGFLAYMLIGWLIARKRAAVVPTSQDDPIAILRKMSKHGIGILAAPVSFKLNNVELQGFPVERIEDGQTVVWVAPKIVTRWRGSDDALVAQQQFEQQVNARADANELAAALAQSREKQHVEIGWLAANSVPNPYHLKLDAITAYRAPEVMVEVQ